jgi:hypothetical protein
MPNRTIDELPPATDGDNLSFAARNGTNAAKVSMDSLVGMVKRSLGYLEKPLVKCIHCGQWGAAYCACCHCGAPIDPA